MANPVLYRQNDFIPRPANPHRWQLYPPFNKYVFKANDCFFSFPDSHIKPPYLAMYMQYLTPPPLRAPRNKISK